MNHKRRWLWVVLFIFAVILWVVLATGWNIVLVRDYLRMLELARAVSDPAASANLAPWPILIMGSVGFAVALAAWILFFIKVLREMKLNQLQAEFLATVSHELKTPIASIELSATLLRAGGLTTDETERLWNSHGAELKRLRQEVETILEAARWQARPSRLKTETLDLESWLNESMHRWKSILGSTGDLAREGELLPRQIHMDLRTLNLITDNLLDNARKFSKGSPQVTIHTGRLPKKGIFGKPTWCIEFHDQGWGFDPTESKKIFNRFFRAHHDAPYSIPGTGLGLYLANTASRALGLKLEGESPGLGQGAVFRLIGHDIPAREVG